MPRKKTARDDNMLGYTALQRCPACNTPDPQERAQHQIGLARVGGLEEVRSHLTEQYVALRDGEYQRPDLVNDVCAWLSNLIEQFANMADPDTGRPLSWYEARQYMSRHKESIALAACARAPERRRFAAEPAPNVPGFARVRQRQTLGSAPMVTPFPDEPDYERAAFEPDDYLPELED